MKLASFFTFTVLVSSLATQMASASSVPGRVEAENIGAFTGNISENRGTGEFRNIGPSYQGLTWVGWISAGQTFTYPISATKAGNYKIRVRAASPLASSVRVQMDGSTLGTAMSLHTSGWNTYKDFDSINIWLSPGNHTLKLVVVAGEFRLDYFDLLLESAAPGRLEVENFARTSGSTTDNGGFGPSKNLLYADNDIAVGWIDPQEIFSYPFTINRSGFYTIRVRAASQGASSVRIRTAGVPVGELMPINTGSGAIYKDFELKSVWLFAGNPELSIVAISSGLKLGHVDFILEEDEDKDLNRITTWAPGVRGIPTRTRVCANIDAATFGNGARSATEAVQAAVDACPLNQIVQLSEGNFTFLSHVLLTKGITVRGRGIKTTVLRRSPQSVAKEPLFIIGPERFSTIDETSAVDLLEEAKAGERTITVRDTTGFSPGQFVRLDEDDYTTARWQPLPEHTSGVDYRIWGTDRLVWPIQDPERPAGNLRVPDGLSWFGRSGRPLSEIKEIVSVYGNTITFSTPIHITYQKAKSPQLTRYQNQAVKYAGVENMSLLDGNDGGIIFTTAAYSWAKNIECTNFKQPCVDIFSSFRVEIRDSHIHDAVNSVPGGGGYALSMSHGSSEILIENNIIMDANKIMVSRSSGAGSVVGYNYVDNAKIEYDLGWVEVGLNASHFVGSHHVLFEGNRSFNYDSDATWGGNILMTIFRNHLTGKRRDFVDVGNIRAGGVCSGSWWHSFYGNVLGTQNGMAGWIYENPGDGTYGDAGNFWGRIPSIWKIGYNGGGYKPDPKVSSTTLRDGNFDYLTNSVRWDNEQKTLPNSFYLSQKPAFFGAARWPWVEPSGEQKIYSLPAYTRFLGM